MKKSQKRLITTLVVLNSISGLQINGISLNAIFMVLFLCVIGFLWFSKGERSLKFKKGDAVLPFLAFGILSCIISWIYNYNIAGYKPVVINYAVNSVAYIFIYVLLSNFKNSSKNDYIEAFVKGLVIAAKIQFIWGLAQLILYYGIGIHLNKIVFVDLLNISNSSQTLKAAYNNGTWNIRVTGLTNENSYFALIECIGMILETNPIWKILFSLMIIVSLSRSGWVMLAVYLVLLIIRYLKKSDKRIKKRAAFVGVFIFIGILMVFLFRNQIPVVSRQIDIVLARLTNSDALNISATRHLLYYPVGFYIWFFEADPIQKLLGFGMRNSGTAINLSSYAKDVFSTAAINWNSSWALECDAIGLLLGGGILTFIAYYVMIYKEFKKDNIFKDVIIIIAIAGIVYNFCSTSYTILIFMAAYIDKNKETIDFNAVTPLIKNRYRQNSTD